METRACTDEVIWDDARKMKVVIYVLCGRITIESLSQEYKLDPLQVRRWVDTFIEGGEKALKEKT